MNLVLPKRRAPMEPPDIGRGSAVGWVLLWLFGVPIPALLLLVLLRRWAEGRDWA